MVGALVGYAIEDAIAKSTFVSIIDVLIEEKTNPFPHTTSYVATLREQGLEMQQAGPVAIAESGQVASFLEFFSRLT